MRSALEFHKFVEEVRQLLEAQSKADPRVAAPQAAGVRTQPAGATRPSSSELMRKTVETGKLGRPVPTLHKDVVKDASTSVATHLRAFLDYVRESLGLDDAWFEQPGLLDVTHFVTLLRQHYTGFPEIARTCSEVTLTGNPAPIDVVAKVASDH